MRAAGPLALLLGCAPAVPADDDTDGPADTTHTDVVDTDPTWRSALYPPDWTPAFTDGEGHFLHDLSWAGWHAGEDPLPDVLPDPVVSVVDHGADPTGEADATAAFQAAIDALVEGGTVRVPAGLYRVAGALEVRRSGVVIAGEGASASRVHFTGTSHAHGLRFAGSAPSAGAWSLAEDADARATTIRLATTEGLAVGDPISVGWTITPAFVEAHGMTGTWTVFLDQHKPFFRRTVVAIEGDRVTIDIPLRYPALLRDAAEVRRDDGALTEVGLVDLGLSTVVAPQDALARDRHHAVELSRVAHGWIRRVRSFAPGEDPAHLQSGGLYVLDSRHVTIADVELGRAQHRGGGGNGYLFEIGRSNEILIRDSVGREGRHNFIQNWDFGTTGCVFLRTTSTGGVADNGALAVVGLSEFHHSLALANLIDDSVADDGWQSVNRRRESSGAGHAGTQNVFWNLRGEGTLRSLQYGVGYVIGTGPDLELITDPAAFDLLLGGQGTEPADWVEGEGLGAHLDPPSLYEDQLARRLGR